MSRVLLSHCVGGVMVGGGGGGGGGIASFPENEAIRTNQIAERKREHVNIL